MLKGFSLTLSLFLSQNRLCILSQHAEHDMPNKPEEQLRAFIAVGASYLPCCWPLLTKIFQEDPDSKYTFDSERDATQSEICREGKKLSKKCITVCTLPVRLTAILTRTSTHVAAPNALNANVRSDAGELFFFTS